MVFSPAFVMDCAASSLTTRSFWGFMRIILGRMKRLNVVSDEASLRELAQLVSTEYPGYIRKGS
jgi:hypothetical protein